MSSGSILDRYLSEVIGIFKTPFISHICVIVTENPIATMTGMRILERGGNVVDAAIAVSLSLAVNLPHLGGIGGDYFALIYFMEKDEMYFINGSGPAPSRMSPRVLMDHGFNEMPDYGPASVTIPGFMGALYEMWKKHGTMEWRGLIEPAYMQACKGFPLSETLYRGLNIYREILLRDEGGRETYGPLIGKEVGQRATYHNLSILLGMLIDDPRAFYSGEVAEQFVGTLNSEYELFTVDDFKRYRARWEEPLKIEVGGLTVYEMPPNTQGISTLQLIELMFEERDPPPVDSFERINRSMEYFRKIYAIRDKYITDPKYMRISIDRLLDLDFIRSFDGGIGYRSVSGGDTTYYAIIDQYGNVISGIQSLFHPFGSRITDPLYGVTFNNRGSSFTLDEGHVNVVRPGKRPLHTLSTPILMDMENVMAHGLSAGIYRPQLHYEILSNIFIYGMDPQKALEYPRYIWNPYSDILTIEEGYNASNVKLNVSEYKIVKYPARLGVASIVLDTYRGGSVRIAYPDIRGEVYPCGGWGV